MATLTSMNQCRFIGRQSTFISNSRHTQRYHNFTDLLYGAPDNPYLPAAFSDYLDNGGVSWIYGEGGLMISRDSDDWGDNLSTNSRSTLRGVFGVTGNIGENFIYDVSANFGTFERKMIDRDAMIADRFFAAIDAGRGPDNRRDRLPLVGRSDGLSENDAI